MKNRTLKISNNKGHNSRLDKGISNIIMSDESKTKYSRGRKIISSTNVLKPTLGKSSNSYVLVRSKK